MKSRHDEIREMLPGFLRGALEEEMVGEVKAHLEECGDCRDELEFLTEIVSVEVPDPGELFWRTLPRRARLTAEAEKRRGFTMKSLFRWLPVPVAAAALSLLVITYIHTHKQEMPEQDLLFRDPLAVSVTDYSDITEKDIPLITVRLADDELYLPREGFTGYSYQREFASLSSGELESLYETLKTEGQTGG